MVKKSEGSQHIYMSYKNAIKTPFGNRTMDEVGVIRNLEVDNSRNYILIPIIKEEDGKTITTAWEVKALSKDCKVAFRMNDDEDIWLDENFKEVRGEPKGSS